MGQSIDLDASVSCRFDLQPSAYLSPTHHKMRNPIVLLSLCSVASVRGQNNSVPEPKIVNATYWGSACPDGGLTAALGPMNTTTNTAPFTFSLANFLPALGSFGSSLRMCNIVSHISVDQGWKVRVNARGTYAQGNADLPGNATMFLRSTYMFAEKAEVQVSALSVVTATQILIITEHWDARCGRSAHRTVHKAPHAGRW